MGGIQHHSTKSTLGSSQLQLSSEQAAPCQAWTDTSVKPAEVGWPCVACSSPTATRAAST